MTSVFPLMLGKGGFTDANNRHVEALDVVEYGDRFKHHCEQTPRRGVLLEALQDGDAYVLFKDTYKVEMVKWMNLCKVPLVDDDEITTLRTRIKELEGELHAIDVADARAEFESSLP